MTAAWKSETSCRVCFLKASSELSFGCLFTATVDVYALGSAVAFSYLAITARVASWRDNPSRLANRSKISPYSPQEKHLKWMPSFSTESAPSPVERDPLPHKGQTYFPRSLRSGVSSSTRKRRYWVRSFFMLALSSSYDKIEAVRSWRSCLLGLTGSLLDRWGFSLGLWSGTSL